eukprot:scaffold110456_cov31-Tisochrysis_lutea.AAC.2
MLPACREPRVWRMQDQRGFEQGRPRGTATVVVARPKKSLKKPATGTLCPFPGLELPFQGARASTSDLDTSSDSAYCGMS